MKDKNQRGIGNHVSGLTALAVCWFFFVVLPVQSYLANAEYFGFILGDLLKEYLVTGLIVFVAMWACLRFLARGLGFRLHILLLSVVTACIIESGPLSIGLPVFNGVFDGYRLAWRAALDWAVWVSVLLLPLLFYSKIKEFACWIALALIVYSTAMIFDVKGGVVVGSEASTDVKTVALVPREDVVNSVAYSPSRNVMMLVVDAVSTDAAAYAFEQDPSLREKFAGFVCYTNNVGMHLTTAVAIPGIMTGEYCQGSRDAATYGKRPYMRGYSWLFDYVDAGYIVYSNLGIGPKGYTNRLNPGVAKDSNSRPSKVKVLGTFTWSIDSLSCARILPYQLKERYVRCLTSVGVSHDTKSIEDDTFLWGRLSEAPVNSMSVKVLNIHHSYGGHVPIVFDRNGGRVSAKDEDYLAYKEQCLYVFRRLGALMDSYRDKGIYDRSAIVILADHGSHMPERTSDGRIIEKSPYPALLVKLPDVRSPFEFSDILSSHTKVSPLMRTLVSGTLTREDLDGMLQSKDRFYRLCTDASISDYYVQKDGTVIAKVEEDHEPCADELDMVTLGCLYSFDISSQDRPYPSFAVENGSRNASNGLAFRGNHLRLRFKVPGTVDAIMTIRSWQRDVALRVSDGAGCPKGLFDLQAKRSKVICIRNLEPDGHGLVSIDMERDVEDGQMVILSAMLAQTEDRDVPALRVNEVYAMDKNRPPQIVLVDGFSAPEAFGVWSDGRSCTLRLKLPETDEELRLEISAHSFQTMKSFDVAFDGKMLGSYDASRHSGFTFSIDCKQVPRGVPVELEFRQPEAARPCDVVHGSGDVRRLGLGFRSLKLVKE